MWKSVLYVWTAYGLLGLHRSRGGPSNVELTANASGAVELHQDAAPLLFFPDQQFSTPPDPIKSRAHYFVLGPETSGTRLVSEIVAKDLGIPQAVGWQGEFATSDAGDAVFHVSLPWGSFCPHVGGSVPSLSSGVRATLELASVKCRHHHGSMS